jgi:anti-anti-sigma factor
MELAVEDRDDFRLVRLYGELDTFSATGFRDKLSRPRPGERFVVDLRGLTFIDSAGLHALFAVNRAVTGADALVAFLVASESPVWKVIELARLGDVAAVCGTMDEAAARASTHGARP